MPHRYHYDPNQPRVPQGHQDGGQWTSGGYGSVQKALFDPRIYLAQKAIEAGLALYTWLLLRNNRDRRAVIAFRAREYPITGDKAVDVEDVKLVDREAVEQPCPEIEKVTEQTDPAAEKVSKEQPFLPAAQYGTAVHYQLKKQIDLLDKTKHPLFAEQSFLKSEDAAKSSGKRSIRVDVYEKAENQTICVYDIKTGDRRLDMPRMAEIATTVVREFPGTQRIIVTEIRPTVMRQFR